MTDIEKRAESVAIFKKFGEGMDENDVILHNILIQGRREGYIKGATEQKAIDEDAFHAIIEENVLKAVEKQKAIDIEKACEWLKNNVGHYVVDLTNEKSLPENPFGQCLVGFCVVDLVRDFRKTLEE